MNIGDCPYEGCNGVLVVELPEKTPIYELILCPECCRDVWYRLSRVDPCAWTTKDFLDEFVVDAKAKTVRPRNKPIDKPTQAL